MYLNNFIVVKKSSIEDFLNSLTSETLARFWRTHCELNKFEMNIDFQMDELINTIFKYPSCFGGIKLE